MNSNDPVQICRVDQPRKLARRGADLLLQTARRCAADDGRFSVAISGGSTPRDMHRLLAQPPYLTEMPWRHTHLFWVDERMVPPENPDSNYGTARSDFLNDVPLPPAQIFAMPWKVPGPAGARDYEQTLKRFFSAGSGSYPSFDLIFLGIGSDGHTASLFAEDDRAWAAKGWVHHVKGGDPHVNRLTLTYDVLNSAALVVFLVAGSEKAGIVGRIFGGDSMDLPAQHIRPRNGRLVWLLDEAAGASLPENPGDRSTGNHPVVAS